MNRRKCYANVLVSLLVALLTSSCGQSYQVIKPNPTTGYFSELKVNKREILISRPLKDVKEYNLVYLRGKEGCLAGPCYNFTKSMLLNLGVFEQVIGTNELEQVIIKGGPSHSVSNITDLVGLNQLSAQIGKFLVVDASMSQVPGYSGLFQFEVEIKNPTDGETYFHAYRAGRNYTGLDNPILYPVFNAIIDWLKDSSRLSAGTEKDRGKQGI